MNSTILSTVVGSMLAMAPIVDSSIQFDQQSKRPILADGQIVVHEWGTFTSLQGSDGQPINGMHHEEESLPSFVYSRNPLSEDAALTIRSLSGRCPRFGKGFEPICPDDPSPPSPSLPQPAPKPELRVTQKMETPVLYFYANDTVKDVHVQIDFPKGIISQYYPRPTTFAPALNQIKGIRNGLVTFDFDILHLYAKHGPIPEVDADSVYAPSREVSANTIQTKQNEAEKLIFYRGLGDFGTAVSVTSDETGNIQIRNTSKSLTTPAAILLSSNDGSGSDTLGGFVTIGELRPGEVRVFTKAEIDQLKSAEDPEFIPKVSAALVQQLVASGLYEDEAVAMTNTWKRSYFKSGGLRLLHILSRTETDALLPLNMQPQPTQIVRTLVGRIEIMTQAEEQALLAEVTTLNNFFTPRALGHLAEPKLRRLFQIAQTPQQLNTLIRLIDQVKN